MSAIGGPNIVENGLVLSYDVANTKSFRGESTTNLFGGNFRDFTGTSYSLDGEWTDTTVTKTYFPNLPTPIGPGATLMTESTVSGIQGLTRYGGGSESGAHSLSAFIYPLTSNINEFTIGLLGDAPNMIYFNLITGIITYGGGITNRNAILEPVPFYPGWYRIGANFEGRAGGWVGGIGYSMQINYAGSGALRSMYITGIQYEYKTYPTPFTPNTRGSTVATGGGLIDQSGNVNNGELVNGVTFDSGDLGSLVFDGVDDYVNIPSSAIPTGNQISIEVVSEWNGSLQPNSIIAAGEGGNQDLSLHLPWNDSVVYWDAGRPFNRIAKFINPNEYLGIRHWVCLKNATTGVMQIYLDGNL